MKGVSAILATILIVMITVAIIGLMYAWAIGLFGTSTEASEKETEAVVGSMQKQAQIIAAACDADNITFTLKASGTSKLLSTELTVFVDDILQSVSLADLNSTESKQFIFDHGTLTAGDHVLKVNAPAGPTRKTVTCP